MRTVLLIVMCTGCAGGAAGGAIAAAAINTSIAVAASGASRAAGGCYSPCTPGTVCNPKTGYCDALPCHGQCRSDQVCMQEGTFSEHCEAGRVVLNPGVPVSR